MDMALAVEGVFEQREDNTFAQTELSASLVTDHPRSLQTADSLGHVLARVVDFDRAIPMLEEVERDTSLVEWFCSTPE